MHGDANPYSSPRTEGAIVSPDGRTRFAGRAVVAILLGVATAFTAIFLIAVWSIGAIDLGRFGIIFLCTLFLVTVFLLFVAKSYFDGKRYLAVGMSFLVPCVIICAMLLAMHDAGVFVLF